MPPTTNSSEGTPPEEKGPERADERAVEDSVETVRVIVPSPLGSLGLEFRGEVVTRLIIVPSRKERKSFLPLKDIDRSEFLDEALGRLSEYLAGARRDLRLEWELPEDELDRFAIRVLRETAKIPYGTTRSFQKLAAAVGAPESYRLVRSVLMANPIPLLVPCHRVVPTKGGVGSYIGGEKKKAWLLKLESRWAEGS